MIVCIFYFVLLEFICKFMGIKMNWICLSVIWEKKYVYVMDFYN